MSYPPPRKRILTRVVNVSEKIVARNRANILCYVPVTVPYRLILLLEIMAVEY
jgi:hypothetical protein